MLGSDQKSPGPAGHASDMKRFPLQNAWRRLFGPAFTIDPYERLVLSSGLFDESWYLTKNPEAARFPGGPLRHFLLHGGKELRDPNPYFNTAWYCENRPDFDRAQTNPLVHYLERGSKEGARPSPDFDPTWYRTTYPDVASAGIEPLSHFIGCGKAEGRLPKASEQFLEVTDAALLRVKVATPRETMALFVTHAPRGRIKPHVRPFLEALAREGVALTFIVAADDIQSVDARDFLDVADGVYLRQNQGYDFAAWAHVAQDLDLSRTQSLLLINDSIIGPLNSEDFSSLFSRIRASPAELIGLTDSLERSHHLQSYFLVAKQNGVAALRAYLADVKSYPSREEAILYYEMPLLQYFTERKLQYEVLFPSSTAVNATIVHWRELIARGFPFVKAGALRQSREDWRSVLHGQCYDFRIAEGTLAIIEQGDAPSPSAPQAARS
jgi:hypothetical protein